MGNHLPFITPQINRHTDIPLEQSDEKKIGIPLEQHDEEKNEEKESVSSPESSTLPEELNDEIESILPQENLFSNETISIIEVEEVTEVQLSPLQSVTAHKSRKRFFQSIRSSESVNDEQNIDASNINVEIVPKKRKLETEQLLPQVDTPSEIPPLERFSSLHPPSERPKLEPSSSENLCQLVLVESSSINSKVDPSNVNALSSLVSITSPQNTSVRDAHEEHLTQLYNEEPPNPT